MLLVSSLSAAIFMFIFINAAVTLVAGKYDIELKYCKSVAISRSVMAVSFISAGITFALNYIRSSDKGIIELVLSIALLWGLGTLTVTDYKKKIVPNKILLIMLIFWAAVAAGSFFIEANAALDLLKQSAIGGAIGGGMFLFSYFITKGQMGAGDVKLAFLIGLYLGSARTLVATLIGTVLCFMVSMTMVLLKKIKLKDSVPMVPFLAIGVWIILLIS